MSTAQARKEMVAVDAPRPTSPCSSTAAPSRSMRHKGKPSLQAFLAAAVIAMLCLQMPVASAGDMIDLLHTKSSAAATAAAADNPDYVSSLGLSCAEHSELSCDKMGALGYDGFEVDELLQSCPESCATSSQKGAYRRLNNNDDDDERLTGLQRLLNQSYTAANNRNADQTCFDEYCQDDPGYLSKIGMRCERFEMFKCRQFAEVGFTLEETDELVNSCPCACKEECSFSRSRTTEPSLVPSSLPTQDQDTHPILLSMAWRQRQDPLSTFPTSRPSSHPSAKPTRAPTSDPTVTPSVQPSDSPSASPTSNPSARPTSDPTVVPSVQPSDSHSSSPTSNPSVRPTLASHKQPSQAPTRNPTPAPSNQPTYEIDLLHGDKRGGTPIKQLSTPEASGADDSFVNKPKSTNTLYLAIYIAAGVAFLGVIYKYKSGGIDGSGHSILSMFTSGSRSVEKTQESGLDAIDGLERGILKNPSRNADSKTEKPELKVRFQLPLWQDKQDRSKERDDFTEKNSPRSSDREHSKEREEGDRSFFQTTGSGSSDSSSLVGSSDSSSLDELYTDEENGSGSFTTASSFESK